MIRETPETNAVTAITTKTNIPPKDSSKRKPANISDSVNTS